METALAILMVIGLFIGVPVLIAFVIVGVVILSDRLTRRAKRAKAIKVAAEAVGEEPAETYGEWAQFQSTKIPANPIIKPHPDGVIEFETNTNTLLTYGGGVIASGPASSLKGVWTLISDGTYTGKLVVEENFIRGLSRVAKNLGIVPGDRIRIFFNTWTQEAKITKVASMVTSKR